MLTLNCKRYSQIPSNATLIKNIRLNIRNQKVILVKKKIISRRLSLSMIISYQGIIWRRKKKRRKSNRLVSHLEEKLVRCLQRIKIYRVDKKQLCHQTGTMMIVMSMMIKKNQDSNNPKENSYQLKKFYRKLKKRWRTNLLMRASMINSWTLSLLGCLN